MAIMAPTVAFLTASVATLFDQADVGVVSIHLAIVAMSIVRGAIYGLLCEKGCGSTEQKCGSQEKLKPQIRSRHDIFLSFINSGGSRSC